mgnify:CR=1 FL=1
MMKQGCTGGDRPPRAPPSNRDRKGLIPVDLRAIKVFVLAAKSLNFTKTGELLYLSPSSVSKYISTLEGEVGRQLFTRDTRSVQLTEYGQALLPYAEQVWIHAMNMEHFISMEAEQTRMHIVHFGMNQDIRVAPPISKFDKLLKAFARFHTESPHVFLKLRYLPETSLVKEVIAGTVQAALVWDKFFKNNPRYQERLSCFRVMREKRFLMFSPRKYPEARSIDDLRSADKVIFAENLQSIQSACSLTALYFDHAAPQPCDTWSEEFLRVISEEGVGFIEESLVELARSVGLSCIPLEHHDYGQDLCIVWSRGCTDPDTLRLVELLRQSFFQAAGPVPD